MTTRGWRTAVACAAVTAWLAAGCGGQRPGVRGIESLEPPGSDGVRPGDVIDLQFWNQSDLDGAHSVDRDGRVYLPLVRSVELAGLSEAEIRERLTSLYREFYEDPLIMVKVKLGVNVTGAVGQPGRYSLDPSFTLFDALGAAAGMQHDGDRSEVELIRDGRRHIIDVDDALVTANAESLRLRSGDWIYVPRRFWTLQRVATYATITVLLLQIITIATR